MNTTRIVTFWNAGEAHDVIEFLDVLRDELWATYGEKIIALRTEAYEHGLEEMTKQDNQLSFPFIEEDPF